MIDPNQTPDWVSPPGDTILDALEEKGWTQAELAERTGYTRKHINQLIKGNAPINEETALKLERALGSNAGFWLNREAQYREFLARQQELVELEPYTPWLAEIPVPYLIKSGAVLKQGDKPRQVAECLRYFGVATVDAWRERYEGPMVAYRASDKVAKAPGAVASWLRWGERQAEAVGCESFQRSTLEALLPEMRKLTLQPDPQVFLPVLVPLCRRAGVVLVVAPAPQKCPVSGLTRWLQPDKALVMLSLRFKSNDQFWFTFFHELAHLLLHGKKMLFLEGLADELSSVEEDEANRWAGRFLIPQEAEKELPRLGENEAAIRKFSDRIGIAPGIVLGRLQREQLVPWATALNHLKVRYQWVE